MSYSSDMWYVTPIAMAETLIGKGTWAAAYIPRIDVVLDRDSGNVVDLKRDRNIRAVIFGGATFDALQVDPDSVRFGSSGTEAAPVRSRGADIDHDGYGDLVLTFATGQTGITCDTDRVRMTGSLYTGR